ncbi:hypothetical protein DFS34DRAFT_718918 [Phlyctochytrium arcticum]|nr:hypothetical protein DFS34DRAFT_718918 [Phlyctochytrium arcticum]
MLQSLLSLSAFALLASTSVLAGRVARAEEPEKLVLDCLLQTVEQQHIIATADIDLWSHHLLLNDTVQLRASAQQAADFATQGIQCQELDLDLPALIAEERQPVLVRRQKPTCTSFGAPSAPDPFFQSYQSYDAIKSKVQSWAKSYPDYVTPLGSVGKSVEGRDIIAFKVTNNKISATEKQSIFFNGGIHAREWIASATLMYVTNNLVTKASTDAQLAGFLDKFEIYIIPMSNPDGYEYSRSSTSTSVRMWRKNRRANAKKSCMGVDLNRNFDAKWAQVPDGSSNDPCREDYRGPSVGSEPEIQAVMKFVKTLPNRLAGIDWHSYGQLLLRPWGWTYTPNSNDAQILDLSKKVKSAIAGVNGLQFSTIPGADLYPTDGATDDWMGLKMGMTAFTFELRDTKTFILPPSNIIPSGEEMSAGVIAFLDFLSKNKLNSYQIPSS